jgi:aerobic carbon-monoxide dehydrogenase small subunit
MISPHFFDHPKKFRLPTANSVFGYGQNCQGRIFMTQVSMTVNGKAVSGSVEGRTLLSDFLRDGLRLTGTHVGCDTSQCGACVVHVDGKAVKSCTILAAEAEGAEVKTIEGMAGADGTLSTIQQAFQDHHGLQCGFCTPGMVMSAAALLAENPTPSETQIREYLEGNICRCTGYHNIIKAILAASGQGVPAETAA